MKNFYLAVGSILLVSSGFSQQLKPLPSSKNMRQASIHIKTTKPVTAKADGDVIYSNTFDDVSDWNEVDNSVPLTNGGWAIGTTAPAGEFSVSMGAIESTTAANGFALFDSDNVYNDLGNQDASLELATGIDFSTKPNVNMEFQYYHRKFNDSIYVEFSINGGAWGNAIQIDPKLGDSNSSDNPAFFSKNVSSIVGGQSNVKIRFRYIGEWDYAWMVDDLKFTESFQNDLELTEYFMTANDLDYYAIPSSQTDFPGVTFGANITNQGYGAQANSALSVKINAQTPVLSATKNLAPLALDTFSIETPIELASGTNTIVVSADLGANTDGYMTNNSKTISVMNGGSTYSRSDGQLQLYTNFDGQEDGMRIGNIMDIYNDMFVAGIRVRIDNKPENVGQELHMEIWKYNTSSQDFELFTANSAEITPANLGGYVYIPGVAGENELFAGETIIVYAKHLANEDFVRIGLSQAVLPQTTLMYFGEEEPGFYSGNAAMIELVEGLFVGLNDLNNELGMKMYPNPANDRVNVSYKLSGDAKVKVTVTDLSGKVVYTTQAAEQNAGEQSLEISTANFSNGVYMVKFEANNETSTQKLVIKK